MTIDELLKIYHDFNKVKPSIDKLEKWKLRALEIINQNVFVRDLVVSTAYPNCYGESRCYTKFRTGSTKIRLMAHIAMLFALANEDHRANNCERNADGTYNILEGKENHITRLSMPEFSLYSQTPMTMAEYTNLYNDINNSEFMLDPNVHVLLSSFAVINSQGKLLNMSLFVEGGQPPTIHSFAKNQASHADVDYGNKLRLFSQQCDPSKKNKTRDAIISDPGEVVYTGSAVEIETVGGARYTQTIDVCVDHSFGHSKDQIERRILGNARENEIIPIQVEQCITSNIIEIFESHVIADRVLHADSKISMLDTPMPGKYDYQVVQGQRSLSHEAIERVTPLGYSTVISDSTLGYSIYKPPFGSDCAVELIAERPAGHYLPALQEAVKTHNKGVIANQLVAARQRELSDDEKSVQKMVQEGTIKASIFLRIAQLESMLLACCQPTFLQNYFKTDELREKVEAKKIIEDQLLFIKELVKKGGDESLFMIRPWKKDLELRLNYIGSSPTISTFKHTLLQEINKAINVDLKNDLNCSFDDPSDEDNKPNPS